MRDEIVIDLVQMILHRPTNCFRNGFQVHRLFDSLSGRDCTEIVRKVSAVFVSPFRCDFSRRTCSLRGFGKQR